MRGTSHQTTITSPQFRGGGVSVSGDPEFGVAGGGGREIGSGGEVEVQTQGRV